jgi:putative nucleotidyltransferase with HDIG domain
MWTVLAIPLESVLDVQSCPFRHCLIDIDLTKSTKAMVLRRLRRRMLPGIRVFACRRAGHHATTQARALGATHVVDWPVDDARLLQLLAGAEHEDGRPASDVVGAIALDLAFRSIAESKHLSAGHMESVASSITEDIGELGIEAWLRSIRAHHAGTYQHCLIVTGLATAFGQALGLSGADLGKLTVAALLHDIGKARIDPAILDKQGPLTEEERAVIRMHPGWGAEHLAAHGTVEPDILDSVRHHHEMLDGSGYPDGLAGDAIPDLARLLTIADIFGALVEERAYKPPMSGDAAFAIIRQMADDGKLEPALVEAFRPVAAQLRDEVVTA